MKKIITLTLFLFASLAVSRAQTPVAGGAVKIGGVKVERSGETVEVSYTAEVAPKAVKRNYTLVLAPVITDGLYRQSLPPVVINGQGSKTARERREWIARETVGYKNAAMARNGETVTAQATVPYQEWMAGAEIVVEGVEGGCCNYDKLDDVRVAEGILAVERPVEPPVMVAEIAPQSAEWIPVSLADSLSTAFTFVLPFSEFDENEPFKIYDDERESALVTYFRVASYDIDPYYMDNAHTLSNLVGAIEMILSSRDSRIEKIVVAGFASPEGSFALNDRLAFERAVSVKKYIMDHTGMGDSRIAVYNGSVDWRGLRVMVEKSNLPEKRRILSIIDDTPVWDERNSRGRLGELQRLDGGRVYRYLLNEYFPYLRSGAFIKVYYENR